MSEILKLESEIKSEAEKICDDIKLDYKKVVAILRSILPQEHPSTQDAINEVKKLAASSPESITTSNVSGAATTSQDSLSSSTSSIPTVSGAASTPESISSQDTVTISGSGQNPMSSATCSNIGGASLISDPKPVDTIESTGIADPVSGS